MAIEQLLVLQTKLDPQGLKDLHSGLDTATDKSGLLSKAGGAIGTAFKVGAAVAGGGLLAGFGASIKVAADFEKSLQGVKAATYDNTKSAEENAAAYAALRKEALQVGKDTSLSASESLQAFGELAKAGVNISDITAGAGKSVVQLAESQGTAVQDMAVLASDARNTFQDSLAGIGSVADQFKFVSNELAKTASATSTDVGQIKFALQAVGPVAAQAGLNLSDFDTAIGLMAQHSLKGADAGTSLKTMLLALIAPTSTGAGAMESLGFSAFDAAGKVRPFRDILGELQTKTKDLSDEEKAGLYRAIFGQDAIRAANILVGEGTEGWDKLQAQIKLTPDIAQQSTTRLKGLSGQIEQLKGSAETLAINLGTKLLPGLTSIAGGATSVINRLIEGDWKGAGTAILDGLGSAFRGGVGLAQDIGGWLGDQIGAVDWAQVWHTVRDLPGQIVGGLSAAGDLVGRLTDWLGDQVGQIDWGKVWAGVTTGAIELFGPDAAPVVEGIRSGLQQIGTVLDTEVLPRLDDFRTALTTEIGPGILSTAKDAIGWLADHPDVLAGAAIGVGALAVAWGAYNVAAGIAAFLTGTILSPITLLVAGAALLGVGITELVLHWQDLQGVFPPLQDFSDWFGNSFVPGLQTGFALVTSSIGSVVSWVQEHWAGIKDLLTGPFDVVVAVVTGQFNLVKDSIQTAFDLITGIAKIFGDIFRGDWSQLWTDVKSLATNLWGDVLTSVGHQLDALTGVLDGAWTTVKSGATQAWNQFGSTIEGGLQGVVDWAQAHWVDIVGTLLLGPIFLFRDQIGDGIGKAASAAESGLQGILTWLGDHWGDVVGTALFGPFYLFRDGIGAVMKAAGNFLLDPLRGVIGGFNSFLGSVKDAINWVPEQLHLGALITGSLSVPNIPQLGTGTADWPGGWAWVGEKGAELAMLPPGTTVIPHDDSVALARQHGLPIPGFQFGLGDLGDIAGGLFDKVGDLAGTALDFAKEWIAKGADKLLEEAFHRFGVDLKLPGVFNDLAPAILGHIKDAVLVAIKDVLGLAGKHTPTSFQGEAVNLPGSVTDWLQQAAQIALGRALTSDELAAQLYLVSRESGGSPDPPHNNDARGLLQTIPGTFAAHALPGHGNILNPVDNAIASFLYQLAEYHNLTVAAAREAAGAQGYGYGGIAGLYGPELAWLGEYGPERVSPLHGFAGGLGDSAGFGTEAQALAYYLAQQVTLLTSLQAIGLADNANQLAILEALRGHTALLTTESGKADSRSATQKASTDGTTQAVQQTGDKTAAAVAAVPAAVAGAAPGGLVGTGSLGPDLTAPGGLGSPLLDEIIGRHVSGGLAPLTAAAGTAAKALGVFEASAAKAPPLLEAAVVAAAGGLTAGSDEFGKASNNATAAFIAAATAAGGLTSGLGSSGGLTPMVQEASAAMGDLVGTGHVAANLQELVSSKSKDAATGLGAVAAAAAGAAQQLDAVGTPGTAPNPYAPSTNPPPTPQMSSYFGDYVLGITPWGFVALSAKQSTVGQGSTLPTGRYNLRGFAAGGILTEPVAGVGLLSGQHYSFAETGPERFAPVSMGDPDAMPTGASFTGDIHVSIPIADLDEMRSVQDFLGRIQQAARARTGAT